MKTLVTGAGGFIGHHLVKRLKAEGHFVRGVDIKSPEFEVSLADEFLLLDLRDSTACRAAVSSMDHVYNLAADMGGSDISQTRSLQSPTITFLSV